MNMTPSETTIYQTTIAIAIFLALMTIIAPRKYFLAPFVLAACFVPTDQRIIVAGLDFTVIRMLVAVGTCRVLLYGEYRRLRINSVDRLLFFVLVVGALVYSIQWKTTEATINRAGYLFDGLGLYWLFRQSIRTWDDARGMVRMLAMAAIILLPFVASEWMTGNNPFVLLGKVITSVRQEKFRCQAAFPHSLMMGLFWAILSPMFLVMARIERNRLLYWSSFAASVLIVIASASSTPLLVIMAALVVFKMFSWRRYTGAAVWSMAGTAAALHIVMNAPVWHLLARINIISGSTGWHRYNLIDKAIVNFHEWRFLGCRETEHWGWGLGDVTNQYVQEGVRGGAITLILFVLMIYAVMRTLLRYSMIAEDRNGRLLSWGLFSMMCAHCIGFIGVSYFGQISMLWYMTLATAALVADMGGLAVRPTASLHYPNPCYANI